MHAPSTDILASLAMLLLVAGVLGYLLALLRLPNLIAFILTGILVGPGGLKVIHNSMLITNLANLGIIFLLFVLGTELTLPRLREMRSHALWAGMVQMGLSILLFTALGCLAGLPVRT